VKETPGFARKESETPFSKGEWTMDRREALVTIGMGTLALGGGVASVRAEAAAPGMAAAFKDGEFVLPPLGYAYDALEPYIDAQTMKLHHDIHHAGYVKGANKALAALKEICDGKRETAEIKHWERELAFNGSGHMLHTIFWLNMSPKPGQPSEALKKAVNNDFGGMDKLKAVFLAAAGAVEGSGWGILGYCPMTDGLMLLQAEKHQNLTFQGIVPLLVLDVWEHAYYLKYQNRRSEYCEAFWNVIDWGDVSNRFEAAKS